MRSAARGVGSGGGKRISQQDFTEKAWGAVVGAPEVARQRRHQIVETEHLTQVRARACGETGQHVVCARAIWIPACLLSLPTH